MNGGESEEDGRTFISAQSELEQASQQLKKKRQNTKPELQDHLLVCAWCGRICRPDADGQESREAKQQTKDIQTHQSDYLSMKNAKLRAAVYEMKKKVT